MDALIVVDVQVDFCPGGALAVPDGDLVIAPINELGSAHRLVVATRDWHPPDHCSFRSQGGIWPEHCIAGTPGAALHPDLRLPPHVHIVDKGRERQLPGYSAFEATDLDHWLRERNVTTVAIAGLALDYCVRATALDARRAGFAVTLYRDATRAVDLVPGDGERALAELAGAGVSILTASA
jgi:nicotinamidase/pyrazinamidase